MENTINRKEYRRECGMHSPKTIGRLDGLIGSKTKEKESLSFSKTINVMLLFLVVLLLKFFGFETEFEAINNMMNSGITFEEIKSFAYEKMKSEKNKNDEPKETTIELQTEEIEMLEKTAEKNNQEENQMIMSDAEVIKQSYLLESPLHGTITSPFGNRESSNPKISTYHTGIDIAANSGSSIVAAHDGIVEQVEYNVSYGNFVVVQSGELETLYGHCLTTSVQKGDYVTKGQSIATVGMTGNATGPHLHFEVRLQGHLVNPQEVL